MAATEAIAQWRELLADLGELGRGLCDAIERGDVLAAIAAMMEMRRVRAAISRVEAPLRVAEDPEALLALGELSHLTVGARAAEAAMERWRGRELPAAESLLASPLGVAVLADALLPVVWDIETDLVVFAGDELAPVAEVLTAIGQRRIIVQGTTTAGISVATPDEAALAVRTFVPNPPRRTIVRGTAGADVSELARRVDGAISDLRIHRNTVLAFSRTWVEQGTRNLPVLARVPSVASVGDRFKGVPMIIAAPGPSLAKNVDQLRSIDGRAIVCAFSHSVKAVMAAGVTPDFILTVDPQDVRYHFAGCDLSRSTLVNAATVHPSLFELPARGFLSLSANSAIDDWIFDALGEEATVPGGGSVATTAFSLALRWQCDPIVFVGLDLSFPGGAYYAATSSDGQTRASVDENGNLRVAGWSAGFKAMKAAGGPEVAPERAVELPGWAGGTVPSSFTFALFHRWFVERMRSVTGTRVFNCTEGGSHIAGMEHVPLADVLPTLTARHDLVLATGVPSSRIERVSAHFARVASRLSRARKLAVAGRALIANGTADHRLVRIERALAVAMRPLWLASLLAQRELEHAHDVARRSDADHLGESAALFATLVDAIDVLTPAVASLGGLRAA